jgi:hypothetical protein
MSQEVKSRSDDKLAPKKGMRQIVAAVSQEIERESRANNWIAIRRFESLSSDSRKFSPSFERTRSHLALRRLARSQFSPFFSGRLGFSVPTAGVIVQQATLPERGARNSWCFLRNRTLSNATTLLPRPPAPYDLRWYRAATDCPASSRGTYFFSRSECGKQPTPRRTSTGTPRLMLENRLDGHRSPQKMPRTPGGQAEKPNQSKVGARQETNHDVNVEPLGSLDRPRARSIPDQEMYT